VEKVKSVLKRSIISFDKIENPRRFKRNLAIKTTYRRLMDISKLDKNMLNKEPEKNLTWYDAANLSIEGRGWNDTESPYYRLPSRAADTVPPPVWTLSKCPAGISIRFSTNSTSLAVRWTGVSAMSHMTATGVSGVDLYVRHENMWRWLAVGRPRYELNETAMFEDLPEVKRDFMLYLPLYNSVHKVELGIPSSFKIEPLQAVVKKPIVFYGTSITQGGCASRPGMCYTSILGRWLDVPVINLGFSGNGKMDAGIMDLLCELDPSIYVLDCLPNMNESLILERMENGIRKLHSARPEAHIALVENILYCDSFLKKARMEHCISVNRMLTSIHEKLSKERMKNLHYIKDTGFIGNDGESTVDGAHLTDLGYMRFSEQLIGPLKNILLQAGIDNK